MPLLGQAAMLLSFDVASEAVAEHDHWHTHEHLAERLSIPGFLRGTRWVAIDGEQPRYVVVYEVEQLETLSSAAYLQRLNHPTPWTSKMMPHYRGMSRGFCTVTASVGLGVGPAALVVRLRPTPSAQEALRAWLAGQVFAQWASQPGIVSLHLLEAAATPQITNEQRIRGADAGVDWAILATAYSPDSLAALAGAELAPDALSAQGATEIQHASYRLDCSLVHDEISAPEHATR